MERGEQAIRFSPAVAVIAGAVAAGSLR